MRSEEESGSTIIETLVAITIVSIALVGSTSLFSNTFQSNAVSRGHFGVISDVEGIIDGYRNGSYTDILDKFGATYTAIADGDVASEAVVSSTSHATYVVRFTAMKSSGQGYPQGVKIKVTATHRRGKLENATYNFETIIAQVS